MHKLFVFVIFCILAFSTEVFAFEKPLITEKTLQRGTFKLRAPQDYLEEAKLDSTIGASCSGKYCICDSDIHYLKIQGNTDAIKNLNKNFYLQAMDSVCSYDISDSSIDPNITYLDDKILSVNTTMGGRIRGGQGSCRGNTLSQIFNLKTGTEYKFKELINNDQFNLISHKLVENIIKSTRGQYDPSMDKDNLEYIEKELSTKFHKAEASQEIGLFIENDKLKINLDSYILGCVGGSYLPGEVPIELLGKKNWRELLP